jgi:hypothetical protein
MCQRLRHDASWAGAQLLTELVASAVRGEEQQEFFKVAYETCLAMLVKYDLMKTNEHNKLKPSVN